MGTEIVIYGASALAKLMDFYFRNDSEYRTAAFTVDREYLTESSYLGRPVVPFDEVESAYPPDRFEMFVAIGYRRMRDRQVLFDRAKGKGYRLVNYVSRRSLTWDDLSLGENNVVMPSVHIEPFVTIGNNNMFWSQTLIAHEVQVGNHNYVAAGCILGGNSVIEDGCFLGNGTILINNIRVRNETHILPGTTVYNDTKEHLKYLGCPARELTSHRETGIVIERG